MLPVHIESGTLWDTCALALSIVEAIVMRIAEDNFDIASASIEAWDARRANQQDQTR